MAVSIARPLFPNTSLATDPNLMLASSKIFWIRFFRRDRSATKLVRSRLSSRKSRNTVLGTKLGLQQSVLQQLSNPLTVFDVSLSSRYVPHVCGIGQQQVKLPFQQVSDRAPINSRTLHRHMGEAQTSQPVRAVQNFRGGGRELA